MKPCILCRIGEIGDDGYHEVYGWKMQLKKARENNHPDCAFAAADLPRELRFACALGLTDTVVDMLNKGHSFEPQEHKTSLYSLPCVTIAACKGHKEIVELLLKRGAKVDKITFIAMATHGWMHLFKTYAPQMPKETLDETLLKSCMRIRVRTLYTMETLVKLGATVTTDVLLRLRKCFLTCLARYREPLKQFIIRHIKHVDVDKDVVWPMLTAGQMDLATHILRHIPPKHPVRTKLLFRVAHSKNIEYTRYYYYTGKITLNQDFLDALLVKGANVNATNHKNQTPLGIACASQNWDVANRLLDYGAIPHSSGKCLSCSCGRTIPIDRLFNNPAGHHCPLWSPLLTSFLWVYKPDGKASRTALRMCNSENFDANVISASGTIPYVYLYQHALAPYQPTIRKIRQIVRKKTKFTKDTLRTIAYHISQKLATYKEFECRTSIIILMMHGVYPIYSFTREGEWVVDWVMWNVRRYGCYYQKFYFAEKAIGMNMNMFDDSWVISKQKVPIRGFLDDLDTLFVLVCPVPLAEPRMNLNTWIT